jgi:hypothetical protein
MKCFCWTSTAFPNNEELSGTYFNCMMFLVASSVVTTILVLNYHHRQQDTHEMPEWVGRFAQNIG